MLKHLFNKPLQKQADSDAYTYTDERWEKETQRLEEEIDHLKEGDAAFLPAIYSAFAYGVPGLTARAGRAIREFLEDYDTRRMMRLDERFRRYTSMEWRIDWSCVRLCSLKNQFETEKDYYFSLILGSFHPNGYHRELCLTELAAYPGALPYLMLRMNDWVGTIRVTALRLVSDKIAVGSLDELFTASQALAKIRRSERREDLDLTRVEHEMRARLRQELTEPSGQTDLGGGTEEPQPAKLQIMKWRFMKLQDNYPYTARRDIYEVLFSERLLEREDAELLMERERNGQCQGFLFTRIGKLYDCPDGWADRYLSGKSSVLRRKALEYKYARLGDAWPGLEELLLDRNHGIREYAAFILEKYRCFDVTGFYAEHLHDAAPAVAVLGLGETGERGDAGLLLPFLDHPDGTIAGNALLSLGRLLGPDAGEVFWPYLFDSRISVSKAAYLSIRKNGIPCGAARLFREFERCTSGNCALHVRKYLLKLLLLEKSWSRLPYLLRIYRAIPELSREGEEAQRFFGEMREPILLKIRARGTYETISEKYAGVIERELELCEGILEAAQIKEIRFDLRHVMR